MGATLNVDSTLGAGSVFSFEVPLADDDACDGDRTIDVASVAPLRVLIAEDNPINVKVLESMMQPYTRSVRSVEDGAQAVQAAQDEPFDLIVMDMHMPHLDGLAASERIRHSAGPNAATPIVALTADQTIDNDRYIAAGVDAVALKPITRDGFIAAANTALSARIATSQSIDTPPSTSERTPTMPDDLLDTAFLDEFIAATGVDILKGILAQFWTVADTLVRDIRQAADDNDAAALTDAAHSLKGAAMNVGAAKIASLSARMEHEGVDVARSLLDTLDEAILRTPAALEQRLAA